MYEHCNPMSMARYSKSMIYFSYTHAPADQLLSFSSNEGVASMKMVILELRYNNGNFVKM